MDGSQLKQIGEISINKIIAKATSQLAKFNIYNASYLDTKKYVEKHVLLQPQQLQQRMQT